ncbi:MAG: FAD-dependent oxidoreductase [Clostridiales bacterium]|jgi:glutamate synthase (NADPH/NADH) small chain|nr:FAD-dependent oxidoreductase [Clostridiales bacterium]
MPGMINRQEMPEQPPEIRKHNFEEVALGFDDQTAKIEAERCLNCKNAKCIAGCPVGTNIPLFIDLIKKGRTAEAFREIKKNNRLPGICGRVCPQEEQCEKLCVRNNPKAGGAVSIGALERYAADFAAKNLENGLENDEKFAAFGGDCVKNIGKNKNFLYSDGDSTKNIAQKAETDGKISLADENEKNSVKKRTFKAAVAGAGPAGLTVAGELAANGISVTVFEAFHKAGGVLVYGIPEFRLPKALVQSEIDALKRLGVKIETNVVIGKTLLLEDLSSEFDAVFIGTGAGLPVFLNIAGENLNGVYSANEFLTRVNLMKAYEPDAKTPVFVGKNVAVVGAGNVAMDAARTALRLGANVTVVYRRGREEMPARREEIRHAEEEGINFMFLTAPVEITGGNGRVSGMKCIKMILDAPDERGRRKPVPVPDSELMIECDGVIVALGTSPNPIIKNSTDTVKFNPKGTIVVDETFMTSKDGVYAAGDAVTGAATVILAMGNGKAAARAIIERLNKMK